MYFIQPQGTPNHNEALNARLDGVTVPPFIPSGLTIQWRQNGAPILGKSGSTDDTTLHSISAGYFDATDAGSIIDFVINGTTFSNPVVLSNTLPTITGATEVEDGYGRVPERPTLRWTYGDTDGDVQFFYQVKIGTSPGLSDAYDSGQVFSTDTELSLPESATALSAGTTYYWTIDVSDGEKTDPLDPDSTTNRTSVSASGSMKINTPPTVSNVTINGVSGGAEVSSLNPVFSWDFSDVDSQPQQSFRVRVSKNSDLSSPIWDSGIVSGSQEQATFNFNSSATDALESHITYYVGIQSYDTIEVSALATESFVVSHAPSIGIAFVDDRINPNNLKNTRPTFTWQVEDKDGDPIVAYEIRVSDNDTDLGTDSFVGDIWHPGKKVVPESFETTLDNDGTAFPGCTFPKDLVAGTKYFFQVQVYDDYAKSEWFTGCFSLNNPPSADNLAIIPSSPFTSDDLEARWDFIDDPGEYESTQTEVRWFKDGSEVSSLRGQKTIPSSSTAPFEEWFFTVRPHDGVEFGPTYTSPSVVIANRPPVASSLAINPTQPKTGDALEAIFSLSDPDGDNITATIRWFKDGIEQPTLRNTRTVPPIFTSVDDEWFFTIDPTDGYAQGNRAQSPTVVIQNTKPDVLSVSVDGSVLPEQLENKNPVIGWRYLDADGHSQQAYQVVIGTSALRTKAPSGSSIDEALLCGENVSGIVATASSGDIVSGNEVFDSGIVNSSLKNFQYVTEDFVPTTTFGSPEAIDFSGYELAPDIETMRLKDGTTTGSVSFVFTGLPGTYQTEIFYSDSSERVSSYELFVDGIYVDKFSSLGNDGRFSHKFKPSIIGTESKVTIRGTSVSGGSSAPFTSLTFEPVLSFEKKADEFDVLSGYVSDGNGGIKLVGLAGTAKMSFPFPSGSYDVDLIYQTESSGNPSVSVSLNSSTVDSFVYESGVKTRTRTITDLDINTGDQVKISGSKGGAASARISKMVFRPRQTIQSGTKLRDGRKYFASVRVYDGFEWSDWHTTRFTTSGSAWVSSVSNSVGWTIEARFSLAQQIETTQAQEEAVQDASATETTAGSEDVLGTVISALQTAQAIQEGTQDQTPTAQPQESCQSDDFQGIRFYDGTAFGWLRLKPDKVELLVSEPLEFSLDGTAEHTYRITAKNRDIKLYVDNELKIDGTGKFTSPTNAKTIEFGDISGRQQTWGSEWESFRYSIDGNFPPSSLVNYSLDELQRFPESSIGRMKSYSGSLYVSVDPNDPEKSSSIYRYDEGFEPEERSVLAVTRSTITSLVVDPARRGNLFESSGKFVGTNRGLQYVIGSKPFPYDLVTTMGVLPDETDDWALESTCDGTCNSLFGDILTIDTTGETGEKTSKYTQRFSNDLWVQSADNAKGWTIEARVKIGTDGSGDNLDSHSASINSSIETCDPAAGISVGEIQTISPPEDDGLNAPGIYLNDGTFQEVVQFFSTGIRLKYARLFVEQSLNDQFYSVRVIGKETSIAVYVKGDNDRFFKKVIFAPDALFVPSQPSGDQELPHVVVDGLGVTNVVYQDSRNGDWAIYYTKTLPKEILARGTGLYSSRFADFEKFILARPGFGLPADAAGIQALGPKNLFSGGASFISWGIQRGDTIIAFSKSGESTPRKMKISSVPHETIISVETEEDLSAEYEGVEYIIMRGEEAWLPPLRVSPQMLDSNNPRLLLTSDVEAFVAYQNYENGSSEIYVRRGRFDPFHMDWKETTRVTNSTFDSVKPDIVQLGNGNLLVVWQDSRNDPEGSQIFASEIRQSQFGVQNSYDNVNITPDSANARNPRAVSIGEKLYVVYEDDPDDDGNYDIFVLEDPLDASPAAPVQLSDTTGSATRPSVASTDNDVYVAYEDDGLGSKEIFVALISNAKEDPSFQSPIRITDSRGTTERPDIQAAESGNVWIAFQDDRIRSGYPDLYVSKFDASTGEWISSAQRGMDTKIENYVTASQSPSLTLDDFGNLGLVWEATKDGRKRLARSATDGLVTIDPTVSAYFPLDDNSSNSIVQNKIRKFSGTLLPPVELVILINRSQGMSSDNKLSDAQSVANSLLSSLVEGDRFNVIYFNEQTSSFSSSMSPSTSDTISDATTFVGGVSASGQSDLNQALLSALSQDFTQGDSTTKVIALVGDGSPNSGNISDTAIRSSFSSSNVLGTQLFAYGVSGANKSLLSGLSDDNDGYASFQDDFEGLAEALSDFSTEFENNRQDARIYDYSYEDQANGTASDNTDLFHVGAPDAGISLRNPSTQGAFDLNQNGKVFSAPISLVHESGAIDLWITPHWPSDDITERVIWGNGATTTTSPNEMVLGVRPAAAGNDLFLRIVDELGTVRETSINNSGGTRNFDWNIDDLVHVRAVWRQNAVGTSSLRSVSFPTTSIGYACSESGSIWKTEDGGATWVQQSTGVTYELYSIDFIDSSTGWACGEFGTVLRTSDGGDSWAVVDTGYENDLNGIFFRTSSIGYAVGSGGIVLRSTDGGNTWSEIATSATSDFRDVGVASDGVSTYVIAVGANGQVFRSTDDGASYSSVSTPLSNVLWESISRTHQAGTYNTYVVGSAGSVIKTEDLGASWSNLTFSWDRGYRPHLYGVSHGPDSNYAYIVGQNGALASSSDGTSFSEMETAVEDGIIRSVDANFIGTGDNSSFVAVAVGGSVLVAENEGSVQKYYTTKPGNLSIFINGIEPEQTRTADGPFAWDPSATGKDLVFGDYREGGTNTADATFDEIVMYKNPPPDGALFRRKETWISQSTGAELLITEDQEKRIEWGDISPSVRSKSFWTSFKMFLCGAKEPLQVFAWNSQLGLVNDIVRDLAMDRSGRLWVATEHGITAFDTNSANDDIERWLGGQSLLSGPSNRFVNFTNIVDGLVADEVNTIAVDEDGNVWAGTDRGLMLFDRTDESIVTDTGDPVDVERALQESGGEAGDPGLGTFGNGEVVNQDSVSFRAITQDDGLPSDRILVVEALDGAVFVGTDKGLAVIRTKEQIISQTESTIATITETTTVQDSTVQTEQQATESSESNQITQLDISNVSVFTTQDGLPSNRIQAIAQERRSGDIWIGTDQGLARFFPDGSISYDSANGLINSDIFSITIDDQDRKYVGTGSGITRIDGTQFDSFQPSEGVGIGAIVDGDEDGSGTKWFATSTGILEMNEACEDGIVRFTKYDIDDGILGQNVKDFKKYIILGGDIPYGGCNKALVNVAVNGRQASSGFHLVEHFPMVVFDTPRSASDKVDVCVHRGWRKVHDFSFDPRNPDGQAFVQTETTRFLLYRKRFPQGDVVLGGNFAQGAENKSTAMYSVFSKSVDGSNLSPISSVAQPSGATLQTVAKGLSIYSDATDDIQLIAGDLVGTQYVALPSSDASRTDGEYLEFTLSDDSFVYVAYDSRSTSLPGWLREFSPLPATFRVTDMDTFVDATAKEKLFASVSGTAGCVFDILKDPDICDISDQIAVDAEAPDGCATISRINASDEAVLALTATDAVTGVSDMQVSAFENFTTDGSTPSAYVPFQSSYTLTLPVEAQDPIVTLEDTSPPDDNPLDGQSYPDIEYTIVAEYADQIVLGSKDPGRVFAFNRSDNSVSFLFDTGEDEVTALYPFGDDLVVGTGDNGRAFRWDGSSLTQIILPDAEEKISSLAVFDNTLFLGTSPNGKIFQMDQFGSVQLFVDTNETSVNGFEVFGGQLFWITTNDSIQEGDILSLTTTNGHRHTITVPPGASSISELTGTTAEVDGHTHSVVNGIVQTSSGHAHQVNGSRSGKVFKLDLTTGLVTIVHSDTDFSITTIASNTTENSGLMFIGTFPNGKILRYVSSDGIFIKSFDTKNDLITKLNSIDGVIYAVSEDDMFFFDGRRWQFFGSISEDIVDMLTLGDDILIVRPTSLGTVQQVSSTGAIPSQKICAFVRFRDVAGNVTKVRDDDGNLIECYSPCFDPDANQTGTGTTGGDGTSGDGTITGDLDGDGTVDNPLLAGAHRIVEIDENARTVFRINGPEPFLSGNRVEEEIGIYYSEIFNGTTSLVQWESLSWQATVPSGSSITIAVRSANSSGEISDATFGPEFTDPTSNDLTNLSGQFLQFRATLKVSQAGVSSPELELVDIRLRTSQATHYFTTNFSLPDELRRGILTYNGCLNPPATDLVFGISGKDSVDFSDYFVISPNKVFEVPSEHQTEDLRVGIKFISSQDQVPVVDEFALMFSLANDAFIRLNLDGQPGETDGPLVPSGDTSTVVTERVQGHTHTVTFPSTSTDKFSINGQTSINAGHSHEIVNGVIQRAAGHTHQFEI